MKPLPTDQKRRGGYYTPEPIARFLARWVIQTPADTILEPGCGDGALLQAVAAVLRERGAHPAEIARLLHGVELEAGEAQKALERLQADNIAATADMIHVGDFFSYCTTHLYGQRSFDAIIGNPPFIRYQHFPEPHRTFALELMQRAQLKPNRLTNAWMPFLVAATLLLNERGRLAMVIPAELLQVNYAAQLRRFLSEHYSNITLVTFKRLVFAGIQQEVVLLLGERNSSEQSGIRTVELEGIDDLESYTPTAFSADDLKPMCHTTEKWTQYFLEHDDILLLRELRTHPHLTRAGEVMDVDVGIVTGLNEFFVLNAQQMDDHALPLSYTQPLVGRSGHLQGIIFSEADWQGVVAKQSPSYLLTLPNDVPSEQLPPPLQAYIRSGEERQFHTGYKCRIRTPWYCVSSVWTPDAFLLRQVHSYPKVILNSANATCTDTIHRIRFRNGTKGSIIAAAFLNSLTFAFAEVTGRSYGGGVLELEPREAETLPLPLTGADMLDLEHLHQQIRAGAIDAVLDQTDQVLLVEGLGLTTDQAARLRTIWRKLSERRIGRR